MGVFLITVLALVGLLGPALKSISNVEKTDEVASVVDSVNAFLNTSSFIERRADDGNILAPRFECIYSAIKADENYSTLFVYRWYDNGIIRKEIGYKDNQSNKVGEKSVVNVDRVEGDGIPTASFNNAASYIYRVILTASSVMLSDDLVLKGAEGSYPQYTLKSNIEAYKNNYLALEIRIFAEDPGAAFNSATDIVSLANEEPIFTYDMAILRD